jgi:hypothetical protein
MIAGIFSPFVFSIGSLLNVNLRVDVSIALAVLLLFLILAILSSFLIQVSLTLIYEDWDDSDSGFMKTVNKIKKHWYEGTILHLAYPVSLIMFLLGGSIFIFFPILVLNYLTNGTFILESGSFMTQVIELLIISTLLIFPAYPALTWGQYYQHRLRFSDSNLE